MYPICAIEMSMPLYNVEIRIDMLCRLKTKEMTCPLRSVGAKKAMACGRTMRILGL